MLTKLKEFLVISICFLSFYLSPSCWGKPRAWMSAEYLYGWAQDSPINVPLITQNSNPTAFGIINEPGTSVIFGKGSNKNAIKLGGMNGARLTVGGWLDNCYRYGIEASGFDFAPIKSSYVASSVNGKIPIINIPFYSTTKGENVLVNRLPNTISVSDTFQTYGFEFNGLYNIKNQINFPLVFLAGFRYLNINEDLGINDAIINAPSFPNSVVNVNDDFATKNNFYGFQVGLRSNLIFSNFIFDVTSKIALGDNYQKLTIKGLTNVNNTTILQSIGLFAEPSNIGTFNNNQLAILPEFQAKLGYSLSKIIRPFVTYNALYINNVIRPGKQIDRVINQSQNSLLGGTGTLTGLALPGVKFNNNGMWMQAVSAGIEFYI